MFTAEMRPVVDLEAKRDEVLADQPFWRSLEDVDPELAVRIERRRKVERLRLFSRLPVIRYLFRQRIGQALSSLEEEGVLVDYAMITPNDYQTAWAGEPGNYLRKAMGDPRRTCIRHLEEAHSAFGRPDQMSTVKGAAGHPGRHGEHHPRRDRLRPTRLPPHRHHRPARAARPHHLPALRGAGPGA